MSPIKKKFRSEWLRGGQHALFCVFRGVSSVVRRCVHRHTGQELAVKIIEITAEKMTVQQLEEVKSSTLKEIQVLNMVKGHPSLSVYNCFALK